MKKVMFLLLLSTVTALTGEATVSSEPVAAKVDFSPDAIIEEILPIAEIQPEDIQETVPSVQEFYSYMQESFDDEDWWSAIDYGEIVLYHFPDSPYREEVPFLMGTAYCHLKQYELANEIFSEYLQTSACPKHFQEAVEMKFLIAEYFRQGGKKHLFGSHKLPAILSAEEDALKIYDEVIAALPHHDVAIQALLGKAKIQADSEDFKPAIESLQLLIRRFPRHDLAAQGFLEINRIYLKQCQAQHLDPNLLDLAEANLQKFRLAFPRESRLTDADAAVNQMKELYAENLLEIAHFYQKRNNTNASRIYLSKTIARFPDTRAAISAREKLEGSSTAEFVSAD
jgi:outer membrane protein assembly factor BamD (BamD/ComL family)